jgi:transcriptional regulator with AAA-type ATPase domain
MNIDEMKEELIKEIRKADHHKIQSFYNLFKTIKQSYDNDVAWNTLTEKQLKKINTGLQQVKDEEGVSSTEVMKRMKSKYGIKA